MRDFRKQLVRKGFHFHTIPAGKYRMSIQANECAYCQPRGTLLDPVGYTSMEVVIKKRHKKFEAWVHPRDIKGVKPETVKRFGSDCIGGWIPVEEIQELYELLLKT